MKDLTQNTDDNFFNKVADLLKEARKSIVQTVNKTMVLTYFEIGKLIIEEEQNGKERAEYGKQIIKELSSRLSIEFGKGFSVNNLKQMRTFYLTYSKGQTVSAESDERIVQYYNFQLSWSHYLFLMRIENLDERKYYEIEAYSNNWNCIV